MCCSRPSRSDIEVIEVPIATVYIDDNASSHFRPVIDSIRVYLPLVRFSMSSLAAAALDFVLVLALMAMTGNLAVAVVGARISSASLNFTLNRRFVFDPAGRTPLPAAIAGYGTVAIGILIANYTILYLLYERLGIMLGLAKLATEVSLFLASYFLQKHFVFGTRRPPSGAPGCRVRRRPTLSPVSESATSGSSARCCRANRSDLATSSRCVTFGSSEALSPAPTGAAQWAVQIQGQNGHRFGSVDADAIAIPAKISAAPITAAATVSAMLRPPAPARAASIGAARAGGLGDGVGCS